jgi:hypothetical protein
MNPRAAVTAVAVSVNPPDPLQHALILPLAPRQWSVVPGVVAASSHCVHPTHRADPVHLPMRFDELEDFRLRFGSEPDGFFYSTATRNLRQVARLERVRSCDGYRTAAEALHGKREVGQSVVLGERLAHQADRARIEVVRRPTIRARDAVTREPGSAEASDQLSACLIGCLTRFVVVAVQDCSAQPRMAGARVR